MMGNVWGIVRVAATKVPWIRVMENIPMLMDVVNRAKGRLREPAGEHGTIEERLSALEEENLRLGRALLQTTEQLQSLTRMMEVLAARQKMMWLGLALSLLLSIIALAQVM